MTTAANNKDIARREKIHAAMTTLRYGVEIETYGLGRAAAAQVIARVTGGTFAGRGYWGNPYRCDLADGRHWKVVSDSSINGYQAAEIVSPILTDADMDTLQEIVRALRRAGAKVNESCGIHVHVDAAPFTAKTLTNLAKIVYKNEHYIRHTLGLNDDNRGGEWCQALGKEFVEKIAKERPADLDEMNEAWYGRRETNPQHYNHTRYHGLNLHNVWFRGTVEFRWFDATLHAGKVKAYVQFCKALAGRALTLKKAAWKRYEFKPELAKWRVRTLMIALGLVGPEFKTCRIHFQRHLEGSATSRTAAEAG